MCNSYGTYFYTIYTSCFFCLFYTAFGISILCFSDALWQLLFYFLPLNLADNGCTVCEGSAPASSDTAELRADGTSRDAQYSMRSQPPFGFRRNNVTRHPDNRPPRYHFPLELKYFCLDIMLTAVWRLCREHSVLFLMHMHACYQQGQMGTKTFLQHNPPVLNWGCWLQWS